MTVWFVSRHPGAKEWAVARGVEGARFIEHLDVRQVESGDVVIGTLPIHLAAAVCTRGARFVFLALDLPPAVRGGELLAADLDNYGARLIEYTAAEVGAWPPPIL